MRKLKNFRDSKGKSKWLFNKKILKKSFLDLRRLFFSGLVSVLPIAFTFFSISLVFNFADRLPRKIIATIIVFIFSLFNKKISLEEANVPGLGIIAAFFIIMVTGYISTHLIGRRLLKAIEKWLLKIPLVSNIYTAFRQIMDTIFLKEKHTFKSVVLVQFPCKGSYSIGFLTANSPSEVKNLKQESLVNVFIPTTPNPTSGFLLMVKEEDIYKLNMSVEEAIKFIVSGGILSPE
ncbi:MAG TPA: DUF502 domain-containing protein [Defluviitaleaceae bacterium]|nr:DUF502 domain-containing protein [Candidatus Epulonipiscium sp.]HOQ16417.1 DUF502 domain-containing protein [Defluviitaleaceae bacterium]HPT75531.1 DUF502 domain-containing protein [Defluviitaleaceae bacterium]HQD51036.1 DUF502 domain-containing protein [Defluviitaleaceae bacterium]